MGLRERLVRQFGNPKGAVGKIAGFIMSHRASNLGRIEWAVSLLQVQKRDHVLEVGFGPGVAIRMLSSLATEGMVYGIDHSSLMLAEASKRNRDAITSGRVMLTVTSVSQLPTFDQKLDKVLDINAFQFWREPNLVLLRLRESMRPGGAIAIAHQPRSQGATEKDAITAGARISDHLEKSGFVEVHIELKKTKPVPTVCVLGRRP